MRGVNLTTVFPWKGGARAKRAAWRQLHSAFMDEATGMLWIA